MIAVYVLSLNIFNIGTLFGLSTVMPLKENQKLRALQLKSSMWFSKKWEIYSKLWSNACIIDIYLHTEWSYLIQISCHEFSLAVMYSELWDKLQFSEKTDKHTLVTGNRPSRVPNTREFLAVTSAAKFWSQICWFSFLFSPNKPKEETHS